MAAARDLGVGAGLDEVLPVDDLAADEAAGDVGVDRGGRVERGLAAAERPGARLLLARGEERDQVELVAEPAARPRRAPSRRPRGTPPPPRRTARRARPRARGRSRRGRSRPRSAASSSAARGRPAARRRRPRAACPRRRRRGPRASRSTSARSFGSPDFACFSTRSSRPATWSRSATSSSRFRFSRSRAGSAPGREAVEHDEQRVDLAEVAEQRRPGPGHVLDAHRDRGDLLGRDDLGERVEPLVGDLGHRRRASCRTRRRPFASAR